MSGIDDLLEKAKGQWALVSGTVRKKIFGANNENIDILVDSFYKLEPPQRNAAIAGGIVGLFTIVVGFLALYF